MKIVSSDPAAVSPVEYGSGQDDLLTVLVVDDEQSLRESCASLLKSAGFQQSSSV